MEMEDHEQMARDDDSQAITLQKTQQFQSWRRKIGPLLQLLNKIPETELEIACLSDENQLDKDSKLLKDEKLADKCEELYTDLLAKVNETKKEVEIKWDKLQDLWKELKDKEEFQLTFSCADSGIFKAIELLEDQLVLRKKEMQQKIEVFIGELRKEIRDIWNQCMITEEEKSAFVEFNSDQYTEEMLDIHKEELKKWQVYHKKNQEILTKIKKREEMWKTLRELEAKADDPNRFVNRGGTLLKDQNMHNLITKNLPKLESELIKMAEKFENEHGRKLRVFGKEIPVIVEEDWKLFHEEKAAKKLNRHVKIQTPLNRTPAPVLLRASSHHNLSRKSIMPNAAKLNVPSSSKLGEKRPGSRLPCESTPVPKLFRTRSQSRERVEHD